MSFASIIAIPFFLLIWAMANDNPKIDPDKDKPE